MSTINMKELLEAGVHYGHQCRRWNPKMKPYIFGSRNGIHIIDLQKTVKHFKIACDKLENVVANGGTVLFIGTKRQARDVVAREAKRCGMFFVNNRWLGGTLTNYPTIKKSINQLRKLEKMAADGSYEKLTKKEALNLERLREKLDQNLGGIKDMPGLPTILFVTDAHKEKIAVLEARKLGIPVVAVTDTNADPEGIDHVIPGNDDSLKALQYFTKTLADACLSGKEKRGLRNDKTEEEDGGVDTKEGTILDREGHSIKVEKKKQ